MIMRISDNGDDNFFGVGIQPPSDMQNLFRPEIANWRFVAIDPAQRILRTDIAQLAVPIPHLQRTPSQRKAVVEQFNESLYFG